jgi:molybdopterin converting factor small subunit
VNEKVNQPTMSKVLIPSSLRPHVDGHRMVELSGDDVGQVLTRLVAAHRGLERQLFVDDGKLASSMNVFVNDENIRDLDGLATLVKDNDEIILVPAMAGG